MELIAMLGYVLLGGAFVFLTVGVIALPFYFVIVATRKPGMSSRQAEAYWREKFKDETVVQKQRETLLRASAEAQEGVLLRAAAQGQETPSEEMLRAPVRQE